MSVAYGEAGRVLEDTTLDEPVSETLNRELRAIAKKLHKVAWMNSDSKVCVRAYMRACLLAYVPAQHASLPACTGANVRPCAPGRRGENAIAGGGEG